MTQFNFEQYQKICLTCQKSYKGLASSRYCSPRCKKSASYYKPPVTLKLKNTLKKKCDHQFPVDQHVKNIDTITFTCCFCKGKMQIRKKPYTKEIRRK